MSMTGDLGPLTLRGFVQGHRHTARICRGLGTLAPVWLKPEVHHHLLQVRAAAATLPVFDDSGAQLFDSEGEPDGTVIRVFDPCGCSWVSDWETCLGKEGWEWTL